jgi:hypothetical protein
MSGPEEKVWRDALQRKGKDWAIRTLRSRYGQPGDAVLDVVHEEPYPTREFLQRWCSEQDNHLFVVSGHTIVVIVVAVVLVAFSTLAVHSFSVEQRNQASASQSR